MEHVDSAIAEVELEIKNVESKAEAADSSGNPETASYWRTEKKILLFILLFSFMTSSCTCILLLFPNHAACWTICNTWCLT